MPAFEECTSADSTHGAPLAVPSCSPPIPTSDYLTVGAPDANGNPAVFAGVIDLKVVGETPIDPANGDQADVQISASFSDVRKQSDLTDYTGELSAVLELRTTDRHNGISLEDHATVVDTPLRVTVPCSPTGGPEGGACNIATTADAVMADVAREGQRAIWQLGQIKVFDGGADGDADTAGRQHPVRGAGHVHALTGAPTLLSGARGPAQQPRLPDRLPLGSRRADAASFYWQGVRKHGSQRQF